MNKYWQFFLLTAIAALPVVAAENMIPNGGFEKDLSCWSYEEWKGLPPPGRISEEKPYSGKKCFVMSVPGKMHTRYLCNRGLTIDRKHDYILRFALSGRDLPKGSIRVRILQYGAKVGKKTPVLGWLTPKRPGVHDLIPDLDGTFDWKVYEIKLPGSVFNPKTQTAAVFFQHLKPGLGELKIDALSFQENTK